MAYPDETNTFTDAAGNTWPDPFGAAATAQPMTSDPAAVAAFQQATAPQPAPPPGEHVAPGMTREQDLTAELDQGAALPPPPQPGLADQASTAASGAPPAPSPGFADAATQQTSSSTTSRESGSTGLSDEAQKRQAGNIAQVAQAQGGARDATAAYGMQQAQQADARAQTLLADAASGIEKTAAQLALHDEISRRVDQKLQAGADWRPDRNELFKGDSGAQFGIMAAVAAMAGAWMQGRGLTGNNPYLPTIMKMIDDNVAGQVRSNSANMQLLREQKGDVKAAIIDLKQRQLRYAQQRLDGLAMKDQSDLMRAGVEKTRQDMQAQDAKWEQEKRQALERTETNKVTRSFSQAERPDPDAGKAPAERSADQGKAQSAVDTINDFGTKAGLIRDKDGKWRTGGGAFPPAMLERLNPFADDSIKSSYEAAVEAYGRLQSGGVIGPEERKAFEEQLGGKTSTRDQLAARLNAAEGALKAKVRSSDAAGQVEKTTIPESWRRK